ncbi:hypothetical protein IAR55_003541 [Kwoniella newhampshirensis]|uniref:FAR1 domain-containing protein n=1 Tax=Kwoniella newhampshirensis TaxID=1651941 RepID=A0AAW0YZE6_9TREE
MQSLVLPVDTQSRQNPEAGPSSSSSPDIIPESILTHGPPPPLPYYPSHKALLEALQAWSITHSFALITTKSYLHRTNQRALFSCSCADRYQPKLARGKTLNREKPKTKRTECLYRVQALNLNTAQDPKWTYISPTGPTSVHNHPPLNPKSHAILRAIQRRLHPGIDVMIEQLLREGLPPRQIVKQVDAKFPQCHISTNDVNNFKSLKFVKAGEESTTSPVGAVESQDEESGIFTNYFGGDDDEHNTSVVFCLNTAEIPTNGNKRGIQDGEEQPSKRTPADESNRRLEEANARVKDAKKMVERAAAILRAREAEARAIAAEVKAWSQGV